MTNQTDPRLPKWPFLIGDAALLGVAGFICAQSKLPLGHWEIAGFLIAGTLGAWLGAIPFLVEYRGSTQLNEAGTLASATTRLKDLELLAVQISAATTQWQIVQEQSAKTMGAAKGITDHMAEEVRSFTEFVQKANDAERANLRLEVDKLRRAETDWLQIIVRMLDHTFALHQAAVRSEQTGLIEQLGHFQNACRDAARRIGLVPFVAAANDPFDPQRHQVAPGQEKPPEGARIESIIATGYTMQGKLLRPALVTWQTDAPAKEAQPEKEPAMEVIEEPTLL